MTARDRRALSYLALSLVLSAAYEFWPTGGSSAVAPNAPQTVEDAEQQLARLRRIAATVPAKEEIRKKAEAELKRREAGLIRAETGAQAQAQMVTLLSKIGSDDGFQVRPIELRSAIVPMGDSYGEATVSVQFDCHIEQLVNFLAALSSQPEILTTQNLQITTANAKEKTLAVRLTVSAVVPKELVPEKKGGSL